MINTVLPERLFAIELCERMLPFKFTELFARSGRKMCGKNGSGDMAVDTRFREAS